MPNNFRIHHGGPWNRQKPKLHSVSYNFGNLTKAGYGGVRLSSLDNTTYSYPGKGLGLLDPASVTPASWTIKQTGGTAGHWTLPAANVAEGASAITPVPSATGVAAQLNGGPYTFQVTAMSSGGATSDPVTITINIVPGAANVGPADTTSSPATCLTSVSSFMSNSGNAILLSTGGNWHNLGLTFSYLTFSNTVTIAHADPTRPSGLSTMNFNSNTSNIVVNDLVFTGDWNVMGAASFSDVVGFSGNASNIVMTNCSVVFNEATSGSLNNYTSTAYRFAGCSNITLNECSAYWVGQGWVDAYNYFNSNITINRGICRWFTDNAFFIGNGNGVTITDTITCSPMRTQNYHLDHFQISDGASPQNLQIIRYQAYQADGNGASQGVIFGGHGSAMMAFVDDGSGNGTFTGNAGNILTVTQTVTQNSALYGTQTINPATWMCTDLFPQPTQVMYQIANSSLIFGDTTSTGSATTGGRGQYVLSGNAIVCNSAVWRVAPFNNFVMNGIICVEGGGENCYLRGTAGNSTLRNFAFSLQQVSPNVASYSYFYATIGNANTPTAPGNVMYVSNVVQGCSLGPPMTIFNYDGSLLPYPNTWDEPQIASGAGNNSLGLAGKYTLNNSSNYFPNPTLFRATEDFVTPGVGASIVGLYADVPVLWQNTVSVTSGYVQSQTQAQWSKWSGTYTSTAPAAWTVSNVVFANMNTTVAANCFSSGEPGNTLANVTQAQWAAMSLEQVIQTHVNAFLPKPGGQLDAGNGVALGALTFDGHWNDGSGYSPTRVITG